MSGRLSVFVVGVVAALTISYLVDNHTVSGQSPTRFAAVPAYGIRLDSGFESGNGVGTHYDAMLAKVIA